MENKKEVKNLKAKPWLNKDGSLKNDEELKKISKSWSQATWEAYLDSLETKQQESLLDEPGDIENLSEEEYKDFWMLVDKEEEEKERLKELVRASLDELTHKERKVIRKMFWEDKSERTIANEMRIPHSNVSKLKSKAFKKIKKFILMRFFKKEKPLYGNPVGGLSPC